MNILAKSSYHYFVNYARRLQDNNMDVLTIVSGDKGLGKSTAAIVMAIDYLNKYSFVCPRCNSEFYKNVYDVDNSTNPPSFYIPKQVLEGKWRIRCPEEFSLNLSSGVKKKVSGCGYKIKYSDRKKIKWSAKKFIAYDNQDVVNKIFTLPTFSPIIADEAVKFAAAHNHNKTDSKQLKELFTVIRPKKFWIFFCIPEFSWIDSKYREAMSSFWIRMIERGTAILFEKDKGEAKEKYHIKEMQEMMGTVKFFTHMDKIKHSLRKHPCYFDMFSIPELPEKVYIDYEYVRNAVNLQRQVEEMELSNKDMAKMMSWNIMKNWDRFKIAVDRSREAKPTFSIMTHELLVDPVTRKSLVSEVTLRNWLKGVGDYIKTKGQEVQAFDGSIKAEVKG